MTLADAIDRYKAARQHVHDALDTRDPAYLASALQVETMWERIVDRKRLDATPPSLYGLPASVGVDEPLAYRPGVYLALPRD